MYSTIKHRVLNDDERSQLQRFSRNFSESLDCSTQLLVEMFSEKLISQEKLEEMDAKVTSHDRNVTVFFWLFKASLAQAVTFREILERRGQEHIAHQLDFLGNEWIDLTDCGKNFSE